MGPGIAVRVTRIDRQLWVAREIQTERLPGAWDLSGPARRAYAERISLDLLAEI